MRNKNDQTKAPHEIIDAQQINLKEVSARMV